MPIHIDKMTTEIDAFEGEFPLSNEQLQHLVELVYERVEAMRRDQERLQAATRIQSSSIDR